MKSSKYVVVSLLVLFLAVMAPRAQADTLTGSVSNGTPVEYIIPVNAGDMLQILLTSTNPTTQEVELILNDQNGHGVDLIEDPGGTVMLNPPFTVIPSVSGNWSVEVVDPVSGSYDYVLTITGQTGGTAFLAPEPSAAALLVTGFLGLAVLYKRRPA